MHWIEEKFAGEKKFAEHQELQRKWKLHQTEVLAARGPEFLRGLQAVVIADVDKWNSLYGNDPGKKVEVNPEASGFRVFKRCYPSGDLTVSFNPQTSRINLQGTLTSPMGHRYEVNGYFLLILQENDVIYMSNRYEAHVPVEKASQIIIETLTDPTSHHIL